MEAHLSVPGTAEISSLSTHGHLSKRKKDFSSKEGGSVVIAQGRDHVCLVYICKWSVNYLLAHGWMIFQELWPEQDTREGAFYARWPSGSRQDSGIAAQYGG